MKDHLMWRKSSYSSPEGNCVEVADLGGSIGGGRAVRDSKNPTGPALTFSAAHWAAFTTAVSRGDVG